MKRKGRHGLLYESMPTFEWEREWEEWNRQQKWEQAKATVRNIRDYRQKSLALKDPLGVALHLQTLYTTCSSQIYKGT